MNQVFPNIDGFVHPESDIQTINTVQYWGFFSKEELAAAPGRLLMLDIDFGRACSLRCPSCFRKDNAVDDSDTPDLSYKQLLDVIDQAQTSGLTQVKICGAGEPLENPRLLDLAEDLTARGIGLSVFTKAHVFGSDEWTERVFGRRHGLRKAADACEAFFRLKTSFLVSCQSLDPAVQDALVGHVPGYTAKRNLALERLAEAGFRSTCPTRLAMCSNPIQRTNYNDIFSIYEYGRERNILPVTAALMISGKQLDARFLAQHDVTDAEKLDLFVRIYRYNIQNGINTLDQLEHDGISCMPGIHPCNQIAAGLYLTSNGTIVRCPGDGGPPLGNVRERSIADLWQAATTWQYSGRYNCGCPYKEGRTLPLGLYRAVLDAIRSDSGLLRSKTRSARTLRRSQNSPRYPKPYDEPFTSLNSDTKEVCVS